MRCPDVLEKLDFYLADKLEDYESAEMLYHLEQCQGCKKEYMELKNIRDIFKKAPYVTPPSDFTNQVMRRLNGIQGDSILREWADFIFAPRVLKWNIAVVALLILAIGIGIFFYGENGLSPERDIINVRFQLELPVNQGIKTVSIVGDFNGWNVENMQLRPVRDGLWEIELPLKKGRYQYMFVVNGKEWMFDPNANRLVNDGFGGKNSLLEI